MIQVRKAAGCSVPVTQLFNTPTITGLAEALECLRSPASVAPQAIQAAGYTPEQRAAGVPCSVNQEQMLVLHAMLLNSSTYNVVDGMRLIGALDASALQVYKWLPLSTLHQAPMSAESDPEAFAMHAGCTGPPGGAP